MDSGLLWYDDDPQQTLEAKISRAAQHYRAKFGRAPNTCYVHPKAVADRPGEELRVAFPAAAGPAPAPQTPVRTRPKKEPAAASLGARSDTVRVLAAPYILRNHFWLGETGDDGSGQSLN